MTVHAAHTTFFLFLSIFPLIMFILNLLTLIHVDLGLLLKQVNKLVPEVFHSFVAGIVENVAVSSSGLILSATVVAAIWSSSTGVYGIMLGLNDVYRTYDTRNYLQRRAIAIVYTFFFVLIIGASMLLLVFGRRITDFLVIHLPGWKYIFSKIHDLKYPILCGILILFFNLMYCALPHGVPMKDYFRQTPGSIFSAGGWLLFSYVYSLYVDSMSITLYGSLATLVFFLLWLWIIVIIIFLGGEINAMIHDHRFGEDVAELKMLDDRRIREAEKMLREDHKITATERYNLRKTTTRQLSRNKLLRELAKAAEEQKKKEAQEVPEDEEPPTSYTNS